MPVMLSNDEFRARMAAASEEYRKSKDSDFVQLKTAVQDWMIDAKRRGQTTLFVPQKAWNAQAMVDVAEWLREVGYTVQHFTGDARDSEHSLYITL